MILQKEPTPAYLLGENVQERMQQISGCHSLLNLSPIGLQFLENTFGAEARPRIAWQIDPFGHSSTHAALMASMGFDALFFGRLDYDDHTKRINESRLQLVWQPSESLGASADLFTGVLYKHYVAPIGFCFDSVCTNDFIQVLYNFTATVSN